MARPAVLSSQGQRRRAAKHIRIARGRGLISSSLSIHPRSLAAILLALARLGRIGVDVVAVLVEEDLAVVLAHVNLELAGRAAAPPAVILFAPTLHDGLLGAHVEAAIGESAAAIGCGGAARRY